MKNITLQLENTTVDCIQFGKGKKQLIMIAGLGDGLKTVKGMALPFSIMYSKYTKEYTVTVISRNNTLKENDTTKEMAIDLKKVMDCLEIKKADIIGVSQGGMIAQHLAVLYPKCINKLVLVVTVPYSNEMTKQLISNWIQYVENNNYKQLMDENVRMMYTDKYYQSNKWMIPFVSKFSKPKSFERFIIMAKACITHDCDVTSIQVPTFIIGGKCDQVVGIEGSIELHNKIKNSKLLIYDKYGHALYEEAKDFNDQILKFLRMC